MSKLEKFKERAKALEARDPKGAVDAWLEVLKAQDAEGEPNPDLGVYNRIGDLYLKLKDAAQAADYYDRAVDRYAELGFHNNAIAMCNKVLRNAPARQTAYLKLAKLYASKGFFGEARQNFVEYAERMQRLGKVEQAFAALRELTDLAPESEHLRLMLEEHLKMYGDAGDRPAAKAPATKAPPGHDPSKTGKGKTSTLVFLDLDVPAKPGSSGKAPPPAARRPEPVSLLAEQPEPEPDESLEIESTSLADEAPEESGAGTLDGLELTSSDFPSVRAGAAPRPLVRDDEEVADGEPMAGLEPTAPDEDEPEVLRPRVMPAGPVRGTPPKMPTLRRPTPAPETPRVRPVQPTRPGAPPPVARPAAPPPAPPPRKTVIEIPPLELEPDFETAISEATHEVDDQPLAMDEVGGTFIDTADDTVVPARSTSGYIDLGLDGIVNQGDATGALVFDAMELAPPPPSIESLEARVADDPDDVEAHRALGEALVERGERERGIEELDIATGGFESAGDLGRAQGLVEEILRLDPNSIRHRQKMVEFAFKTSDKQKLIAAYVELADALLRGDLPEKARSVYERVAEHDPGNQRAQAALGMLVPPVARAPEGKVKAKDAKMTVRDGAGPAGAFVDLSALLLEEDEPERDTRMKVQEEEPTGDEEQDFQDMLTRFKQGIDENIDDADFQSHYDLGVAFKEMGLLDEAISELQKALRAPEQKLRTSEALGACFFEKGAHTVAESILRRGLELPASGDQERLGVLYWLARALEAQGNAKEARALYGRVFAVDIRFLDVEQRAKALAKAR